MSGIIHSSITDEQKEQIISEFLVGLGSKLKTKRKRMSLSQSELSKYLGIDQTTLSKYENGERDMNVSLLPLLSIYCDFPLYELFPKNDSELLLKIFDNAVQIIVDRKLRQQYHQEQKDLERERDGVIFSNMYSGMISSKHSNNKNTKSDYKDAAVKTTQAPFDTFEFCDYIMTNTNDEDFLGSIIDAGQLLMRLEFVPNKNTLKGLLADYIVDGLVINDVTHKGSDKDINRAYAYYKTRFNEYMSQYVNDNGMPIHHHFQ